LDLIEKLREALDKKFAEDLVVLDIGNITTIADYFVIASGGNAPQIRALAAAAEETMLKDGRKLRHAEGLGSANWVLLDFGEIIVHIFDKESRAFYSLERVWGDAKMV